MKAGWIVIFAGLIIVVVGLLMLAGLFGWFGRLPGDIRLEGERSRVYIPVTSMILLSIVLSVILYLVRKFF